MCNKLFGKFFGCGDVNCMCIFWFKFVMVEMRFVNVCVFLCFGLYIDLNFFAYVANGSSFVDVVVFIGVFVYEFMF